MFKIRTLKHRIFLRKAKAPVQRRTNLKASDEIKETQ